MGGKTIRNKTRFNEKIIKKEKGIKMEQSYRRRWSYKKIRKTREDALKREREWNELNIKRYLIIFNRNCQHISKKCPVCNGTVEKDKEKR
jgi:hypothetical protein